MNSIVVLQIAVLQNDTHKPNRTGPRSTLGRICGLFAFMGHFGRMCLAVAQQSSTDQTVWGLNTRLGASAQKRGIDLPRLSRAVSSQARLKSKAV